MILRTRYTTKTKSRPDDLADPDHQQTPRALRPPLPLHRIDDERQTQPFHIMSAFAQSEDSDGQDFSYISPDPATTTPPIPPEQSTSSDAEASHGRNRSNKPLLGNNHGLVSELEQEVLDEYSRLLRNVNQVRRTSRDRRVESQSQPTVQINPQPTQPRGAR